MPSGGISSTSCYSYRTNVMVNCALLCSAQNLTAEKLPCNVALCQHNTSTPASARPHVVVEVVLARKVLQTGWTFEWPLACVRPDVVLEHVLAGKPLWAQVAMERLQHGRSHGTLRHDHSSAG